MTVSSLLPVAALLSFLAILVVDTAIWLARRHKITTTGSRKAQLNAEMVFLRREAAKLNTPSTYAKCAKYQRLANAKEKELGELTSGSGALPSTADRLLVLFNTSKVLMMGLMTLTLWGSPMARIPPSVSAPVSRLLGFPNGRELGAFGLVAVTPWLAMCDSAANAVAKALFPQQPVVVAIDAERLAKDAEMAKRVM